MSKIYNGFFTSKIYHHHIYTCKTYHCLIRYQENLSQSYLLPIELTTIVFITSKVIAIVYYR